MMRTDRLMGKMVGESVKRQVESSWFVLGESFPLDAIETGREGGKKATRRVGDRFVCSLFLIPTQEADPSIYSRLL